MNITTNRTLTSKLYPEITYEARTFSEGRRQALVASIADAMYQYHDLVGEANALLPEEGDKMTSEQTWKRQTLIYKIDELTAKDIHPAWLRAYVTKINGLEFDGVPATVETFITEAPSDLFAELVQLIKGEVELSDEERKN